MMSGTEIERIGGDSSQNTSMASLGMGGRYGNNTEMASLEDSQRQNKMTFKDSDFCSDGEAEEDDNEEKRSVQRVSMDLIAEDSGHVIPPAEHRPSKHTKQAPSTSTPVDVIEEEDEEDAMRASG